MLLLVVALLSIVDISVISLMFFFSGYSNIVAAIWDPLFRGRPEQSQEHITSSTKDQTLTFWSKIQMGTVSESVGIVDHYDAHHMQMDKARLYGPSKQCDFFQVDW